MWQFKHFTNRDEMLNWIEANEKRIQWDEIYVHNGYCIEYRKLRAICADHGIENVAPAQTRDEIHVDALIVAARVHRAAVTAAHEAKMVAVAAAHDAYNA